MQKTFCRTELQINRYNDNCKFLNCKKIDINNLKKHMSNLHFLLSIISKMGHTIKAINLTNRRNKIQPYEIHK